MARHNIELIYNPVEDRLEFNDPGTLTQAGDELTFESGAGPVRVLMIPEHRFSAAEYRTGDAPIVVKDSFDFTYCCGLVVDGHVVGYPEHRRFGNGQGGSGGVGDDTLDP